MIDYDSVLCSRIKNVPPSGIRKYFDLLAEMEDAMFNGETWCPDEIPYPKFDWNPNQGL